MFKTVNSNLVGRAHLLRQAICKESMNTIRVDICYRPLRIAWAIRADDIDAFRKAVRLSYALWGGRFNPIIVMDREDEAKRLIDLFRVDLIWPIRKTDEDKIFTKKFPHLIKPFLGDSLFDEGSNKANHAQVLDIQNALIHLCEKPEWSAIKERGVRLYTWKHDDPLADVFLMQLGAYPNVDETGIDYRAKLTKTAEATEHFIDSATAIPKNLLDFLSIAYLSRHGLKRYSSLDLRCNTPGFFLGDANNLDDLVCYWNLRAADIPMWFIDSNNLNRYVDIIPAWEKTVSELVAQRHEWERNIAVWYRCEDIYKACSPLGEMQLMRCQVSDVLWNGRNVRAPMMYFSKVSVLGVTGQESEKTKVSFALNDKPFCDNSFFYQQHLVASLSFIGGFPRDEQNTLVPPYLPELNELYAREMYFQYGKLRIEPDRVGLVINVTEHDAFLYALRVSALIESIFSMAGYNAKLSNAGLIARQLIAHLGGLSGARVFKIPGVRRLLKTHGPEAAIIKRAALDLIGSKDPENLGSKFSDYEDLYIEQRPAGTKLKPDAVFAYLVEKNLFRIGAKLTCPNCNMSSWTALDTLKQHTVCELCGQEHDATRQLVNGEFYYRRSGVLGAEKNAQGAVPVVLTLQQLAANIHSTFYDSLYSPSLNFKPKNGSSLPECEIDFAWILPRSYSHKTAVILGECKDNTKIDIKDINNLRCIADALPRKRFKTFILLSKLCSFTVEEIELAKTLNDKYRQRVILLTARELEPYHIYERTKTKFDIKAYGSTPEDLARVTSQIYF